MAKISVVNNDIVQSIPGDIVKGSGQAFGVVPAQANAANLGLLGVWQTATGVGKDGTIGDSVEEVNCAVTVAVNDKLYLSAITPGKATNVAPAYPYLLGVVLSARTVSGVQKATISFRNQGCSINDTYLALLTGVPSTGTVTCLAVSATNDNDRFTIGDGVHTASHFEYQKSVNTYATGSITAVARTQLLNNQTFTINDGANSAVVFEFKATPNVYATGSITAVAKASLLDNQTFTINDGVNTAVVFEFKVTGGYVRTGTDTTVDVSGATDAASVAAIIRTAINGVTTALAVTAGTVVGAVVPLTNDAYGAYNTAITETVVNAGFVCTGMTGGVSFVATGADVTVDVSTATDAASVAAIIRTAINGVTTALAVTAGTVVGAVVPLTNDAYGAYNTAITDTVVNAGFVCTGMSGGAIFTPTSTYTAIPLYSLTDTTATGVAVATAAAIAAAQGNFIIPTPTSGVINITNKAVGTGGNVSTIKTAGGMSVTGMSGGVASAIVGA